MGGVVLHPPLMQKPPGKNKPCISAHSTFVIFSHASPKSQQPNIGLGVGVGVGMGVGVGVGVGGGVGVTHSPSTHILASSSGSHLSPSHSGLSQARHVSTPS